MAIPFPSFVPGINTLKISLAGAGLSFGLHAVSHGYIYLENQAFNAINQAKERLVTEAAASMGYVRPAPTLPRLSLREEAERIALNHGINPAIFRAVVSHESRWDPFAVSKAGALGLAQVMPEHLKFCGLKSKQELFDPIKNLNCGAKVFKEQLRKYPLVSALRHYNASHHCVISNCSQENIEYPQKVFAELVNDLG